MKPGRDGGIAARRAIVRWAVRLFRREWRQQILVLAVLTLAVAGATVGESAGYSVVPSATGALGTASHRLQLRAPDGPTLQADIDAATRWFGVVDVITARSVPIPGSVDSLELRSQDPGGPYGGPMLRLVAGRYPTVGDELALTAGVARILGVGIGGSPTVGGTMRTVVGLVENPNDLDEEFALEPASAAARAEAVVLLVRADRERVLGFRTADGGRPAQVQQRGDSERGAAAALGFGVAAIVLMLVSLIAAASFAVLAQRRLRQLGMVAAIGATPKQLRLVMVANGAAVGAVAAVAGTVAGLSAWLVIAPRLSPFAGHRIDRFDLPWLALALGMALAVVVATAAAWWPARAVARLPITLALSARTPRPKSVHRSALAAGVLLLAGFAGLTLGIDPVGDKANPLLVIGGVVALAGGLVMASPLAVRAIAAFAGRAPLPVRLALRDLGRYQARSSAALAAISLALAIAVTVVLAASAAVYTAAEGNLSDRQIMVRIGNDAMTVRESTATELARLDDRMYRLAATFDGAAVVPLDVAVDPAVRETQQGQVVWPAVSLGRRISPTTRRYVGVLYVATPELLGHLGLGGHAVDPSTDVLTVRSGDLAYVNGPRANAPTPKIEPIEVDTYSSTPTSLITAAGLGRAGWKATRAGWLIETPSPLTGAQLRAAREAAAEAGLTVEARNTQQSLTTVRSAATATGTLLALAVLALTVGLIRGESAADLRMLTATGASSRVRRTITATTASALGLLGVLLGTATAYLGMVGGYLGRIDALGRVPVTHLVATTVGVPVAAAVAGWLLAGGEPPGVNRAVLD